MAYVQVAFGKHYKWKRYWRGPGRGYAWLPTDKYTKCYEPNCRDCDIPAIPAPVKPSEFGIAVGKLRESITVERGTVPEPNPRTSAIRTINKGGKVPKLPPPNPKLIRKSRR